MPSGRKRKHKAGSSMIPVAYPISIPGDIHALVKELAPVDHLGRKTVSGMIRSVLEARFSVPSDDPLPIAATIDQKAKDRKRATVFLKPAFMRTVQHECERQHGSTEGRDKRQSVTNRVIVALLAQAVTTKTKTA